MNLEDNWRGYFDKWDINLIRIGKILYLGDFDRMEVDIRNRLVSNLMYQRLEERLSEDLGRIERLKYFISLEEFITRKIEISND